MSYIPQEQLDAFIKQAKPSVDVQVEGKRAKVKIGDRAAVVLRTDLSLKEAEQLANVESNMELLQAVTVGKPKFETWTISEVATLAGVYFELFEALQGTPVGE